MPIQFGCFENKVAVVTGANGGMGSAIVRQLIQEGAIVRGVDIAVPKQPVPDDNLTWHIGDLADGDTAAAAVDDLDSIDYLVNAAGVIRFGEDVGIEKIDMNIWDAVFDANLRSAANMIRSCIPRLVSSAKNGSHAALVNVATTQCLRGDLKPQDAYQASKAGLIALTKSIAIQYAADGVRANSLIPGPTDTAMQSRWQKDPVLKAATEKAIPLGRVATADDMASACLFLLSDGARHITGTELVVDGGALALP